MTLSPIQHLKSLQALLEMLASEGIEMQSHEYDGIAFGNFTLVLAKGHAKVRFIWDGRESILEIQCQEVQNKSISGNWLHDAFIKVSDQEAVFAEIGSNAEAILQ